MNTLLIILVITRYLPEVQYGILYKTEKECQTAASAMTRGSQLGKCVPLIKNGDS